MATDHEEFRRKSGTTWPQRRLGPPVRTLGVLGLERPGIRFPLRPNTRPLGPDKEKGQQGRPGRELAAVRKLQASSRTPRPRASWATSTIQGTAGHHTGRRDRLSEAELRLQGSFRGQSSGPYKRRSAAGSHGAVPVHLVIVGTCRVGAEYEGTLHLAQGPGLPAPLSPDR